MLRRTLGDGVNVSQQPLGVITTLDTFAIRACHGEDDPEILSYSAGSILLRR